MTVSVMLCDVNLTFNNISVMFVIVAANVSLDFDEYVVSEDSTTLEICIETLTGSTKCSVQYDFNVSIITPFSGNVKFKKSVHFFINTICF